MAEQIISPGVFTRENDLSFLPAGVAQIGAAIIGPTEKGPAFIPTVVTSFADFERRFGSLSPDTYVPQTVREYLKNGSSVTVVRVLAGGGYSYENTNSLIALVATGSSLASTSSVLLGVIAPSLNTNTSPGLFSSSIVTADASPNPTSSFTLTLTGSGVDADSTTGTNVFTVSMNPANTNYWANVIGDNPKNSKNGANTYTGTGGYTYINFKDLTSDFMAATATSVTGYGTSTTGIGNLTVEGTGSFIQAVPLVQKVSFTGDEMTKTEGYSHASTPYIQGQLPEKKDLFRFHTLDHGKIADKYKISIANFKEPADIDGEQQYTQFSVILRDFNDKDNSLNPIEQYNNCTLDPGSPRYIARMIGDRYQDFNETLGKVETKGNYPNISKHIRVEVMPFIEEGAASRKLAPRGFKAIRNPFNTLAFKNQLDADQTAAICFPSASYEGLQTLEDSSTHPIAYSTQAFLGFKFADKEPDNLNFIKPLHGGDVSHDANVSGDFNVGNFSVHPSASITYSGSLSGALSLTGLNGPTKNELKFTVPFQGGEDGLAPHQIKQTGEYITSTNVYGFDLSATNKTGYTAYKKTLDILSNQDEYDINMLVLPGVIKNLHSSVTSAGINMCEERGDVFYVMDLSAVDASVNTAVNDANGLDTNFAAVYYPWVKVIDDSRGKPILVPPSVIVPGAIAASDRIGAEWFAPAGLNRGILGNVLEAKIRLNQAERDTLYDAKINPIATFPQTGVCIWGQKTLQERSTALDRINVRRLLITLKKFIASSSKYLVFEQNTLQTRTRFLNIVNPYLENIQQQQGLFAFRVVMDDSNNTPEVVDRNQLVGAIFLQPTKTAEFIILDFNVLPTGATFPS